MKKRILFLLLFLGCDSSDNFSSHPVLLDFKNAVAIALTEEFVAQASAQSNLMKVDPQGGLSPAVSIGSLQVDRFILAPDGATYLILDIPVWVNGGQIFDRWQDYQNSDGVSRHDPGDDAECLFLKVNVATDSGWCFDKSMGYLKSSPIQFDDAGVLYYLAVDDGTVLRRNDNGVVTDYSNDNIDISWFVAAGDGSVFLQGRTRSSGVDWLRKISSDGVVEDIGVDAFWGAVFPDGNVYFGAGRTAGYIWRYLVAEDELDPTPWFSGPDAEYADPDGLVPEAHFSGDQCFLYVSELITTSADVVFGLCGTGSAGYELVQYYPEVTKPAVSVTQVTVLEGLQADVILGGYDEHGQHALILYDTLDGTEVDLLGGAEIEVYRASFAPSLNAVMFDGLRFADNSMVICQVEPTGETEPDCVPTGQSRLVDFEAFGN